MADVFKKRRAAQRKGGRHDEGGESPEPLAPIAPQPEPESPLDFAKSVYRDAAQPMALRASMAKAALPYLNKRGAEETPEEAREKLPHPFNMPDPYGSLRVDWRDALEKAGLIPTVEEEQAALYARAGLAWPARPDGRSLPRNAASAHDAAAQARAEAMEQRALAAEAELGKLREEQAHMAAVAAEQGDAGEEADAPSQLGVLRERLRAAQEKARDMEARWRRAEMRANDMEQRALSTEAILQRGR